MSVSPYQYPTVFTGYEEKRDSLRVWARRRFLEAFDLKPGTLLDVGCGEGFWGEFFREWGFTVTGIDKERDFIATGRIKYPDLELLSADVEKPLGVIGGRTFDVVFVKQLPHFYAEDLEPAKHILERLHRHVGGTMLLSFYSEGDGKPHEGLFGGYQHWHHRFGDLSGVIQEAGYKIWRQDRRGRYLQIGAH